MAVSYLVRDLDDTSLTYDNEIDGENFDKKDDTTNILTVIMSLFDKFPGHEKRDILSSVREVLRLRKRDRLSVPFAGGAE